jgi:hypothetical protein
LERLLSEWKLVLALLLLLVIAAFAEAWAKIVSVIRTMRRYEDVEGMDE